MQGMLGRVLYFFWVLGIVNAIDYAYKGCLDSQSMISFGLVSKGFYTYQSVSYCQQQCAGQPVVALLNGGECYCGDSSIINKLSTLTSNDGNCKIDCNGWPYQYCGGASSMDVYVDSSAVTSESGSSTQSISSVSSLSSSSSLSSPSTSISTNSIMSSSSDSSLATTTSSSTEVVSSSATTTSTSSTSFSSSVSLTSFTSSSIQSTKDSSSQTSSKVSKTTTPILTSVMLTTRIITTALVSGVNDQQRTVFVTATSVLETATVISPTASGGTHNNNSKASNSKSSSLSGGAIAGIVVGVVVGTAIIIAVIVLVFLKRRSSDENVDIEESKQHQPYSFGDVDANPLPIPERTASSRWNNPSRNNTSYSNGSDSSSFDIGSTASRNNVNTSMHSSSVNSGVNLLTKQHFPSTVFEEELDVPNGIKRFSATSLPDARNDRQLRIANPENEKSENNYEGDFDDSMSSD